MDRQQNHAFNLKPLLILCLLLSSSLSFGFEPFVVKDIRLEGLGRISPGTVFNYLPLQIGDTLTKIKSTQAINELYKTGMFNDVYLGRDENNILVVHLEERPAIAEILFTGNQELETEDLEERLKAIDFAIGRVFNRSLLEKVELELQRFYFSLSRYDVQIETFVTPLPRNRVAIQVDIAEGALAKIQNINIVGNESFSEETLLDQLELDTGNWFSFFTKSNQYSRQKLAADLETLNSFYQDRGYIKFNIASTQVSITPDHKGIYITINLEESNKYTISSVELVGDLPVPAEELHKKITIEEGDVFSRKEISRITEAIVMRVGDEGYFAANINSIPDINEENKTVDLTFFVEPNKRIYVRNINFKGNTKTRDEVLRREMRQMESAWVSNQAVKRSRTRLERLGYFESVNVETPAVPGVDDQIDINYSVVEQPSGMISAGFGYAQTQGLLLTASIDQDNFLGTGKRVGASFSNSRINTIYRISYLNPYTTINGISRNTTIFYRETDAEAANLSRYIVDAYGANLIYGYPLSEYLRIQWGAEFDNTALEVTDFTANEIRDFILFNGDAHKSYRLVSGLRHDTRDRGIFATRGHLQGLGVEVTLPFSDLNYYKVFYRHKWLIPLPSRFVFSLEGNVSYGDGYGDNDKLPFYENYTAGGPTSVRGFEDNTLGPLDSEGYPFGGNFRVLGNAELFFPLGDIKSARFSTFVDVGNVFAPGEDFDSSMLRYSAGAAIVWMSPMGILRFSLAKPLNKKEGDRTQLFQFSIGASF